jgi:hypothetical protein
MAIQRVPIDMLNATSLAEHVVTNMGLDVKPQHGVAGIKAKLAQAGYPIDFIEIDDGREEPEIQRRDPPRERHTPGKRMVNLRIEPQEKPGGAEPVFTSVNGSNILVPRAQTCWLEYKFYEALIHAEQHVPIQDEDLKIIGWRSVPEYPISVFHIEDPLPVQEKVAA